MAQLNQSLVGNGSVDGLGPKQSSSIYGAVSSIKVAIQSPISDIREATNEALSIRDFWNDMVRRERTGAHQATLVLGFLQTVLTLCYVVVCATDHTPAADRVYLSYVGIELSIAGVAQLIYSTRGICLENSSMLLMAAVNGVGMSIRLGLSIDLNMLPRDVDIAFFAIFTALTVFHVGSSLRAWGGEFSRFIAFRISTDTDIQRIYRKYELHMAVSMLDCQVSAMAISTVLFFTSVEWWHYFLFGAMMLVTFVQRSALRHATRNESVIEMQLWGFFSLGLPFMVGFALFRYDFVEVTLTENCKYIAYLTAALFLLVRVLLCITLALSAADFGKGMKEVLENQKSSTDFFKDEKQRFRPMFLADGEIAPQEKSYRFDSTSKQALIDVGDGSA